MSIWRSFNPTRVRTPVSNAGWRGAPDDPRSPLGLFLRPRGTDGPAESLHRRSGRAPVGRQHLGRGPLPMSLMLEERPAPPPPNARYPGSCRAGRPRRRSARAPPSILGWLAALVLAAILVLGAVVAVRGWSFFGDVFAPRTIDRSAPVLVQRLRNQCALHRGDRHLQRHGRHRAQDRIHPDVHRREPHDLQRRRRRRRNRRPRALPRRVVRAADGTIVLRLPAPGSAASTSTAGTAT